MQYKDFNTSKQSINSKQGNLAWIREQLKEQKKVQNGFALRLKKIPNSERPPSKLLTEISQ
jgi:hypothetical protein